MVCEEGLANAAKRKGGRETYVEDGFGVTSPKVDLSSSFALVVLGVELRPLDARLVNLYSLDPIKLVRERDRKQSRATVGIDEVALDVEVPRGSIDGSNRVGNVGEERGEDRVVVLEEAAGHLLELDRADLLSYRRVVVGDADVGLGGGEDFGGDGLGRAFCARGEGVAEEEGGAALVVGDVSAGKKALVELESSKEGGGAHVLTFSRSIVMASLMTCTGMLSSVPKARERWSSPW